MPQFAGLDVPEFTLSKGLRERPSRQDPEQWKRIITAPRAGFVALPSPLETRRVAALRAASAHASPRYQVAVLALSPSLRRG